MKHEKVKFKVVKLIISNSVFENMKKLYRNDVLKTEIIKFYFSKLKSCMLILFLFTLVAVILKFSGKENVNNGKIKRNESGGIDKNINMEVFSEEKKLFERKINIPSKKYSDAEIEKLYISFDSEIIDVIKGENKSIDHVTNDLVFKKYVAGFPFKISYKTNRPLIISSDGKVKTDNVENEEIVEISITAEYENFEETKLINVQVFKKEKTGEEGFIDEVEEAIAENNNITKNDDYLVLPANVNGRRLTYKEKDNGSSVIVFMLGVIAATFVYFGKDKEINDRIVSIKKEMDIEYPLLVNKFALFYNANMPVKKIWHKLCNDYEKEKNVTGVKKYVYEEMVYARNLMNEGMSEIRAYEEFAKRCNTHRYRTFINMIEQAVTKGKKDMSKILIDEARDAFTQKKNNAKKYGEEAGTKLLIPMLMMLMVVMVIVIFPAFSSFKM